MWRVTLKGLLAHKLRLALTALAIVLGVGFVAGTYVLTDTIDATFSRLFTQVSKGLDVEVRSKEKFGGNQGDQRRPMPAALRDRIARVPGVRAAEGGVSGYAQMVGRDGKAVTTGGAPTLGISIATTPELRQAVTLRSGAYPSGPGQVVVDKRTASKEGFKPGDRIRVLFQGPPREFTVSGVVGFGDADNLAGATLAGFDLATAQDVLARKGVFDGIDVVAADGVGPETLRDRVSAAVGPSYEALTGEQYAEENAKAIGQFTGIINTALLAFAFIALFVGSFIIVNTFSIILAQRSRELALLRCMGASRRQLMASVLAEAGLVGLVASVAGLGAGILIALGLQSAFDALGLGLPSTLVQIRTRTVVVALLVGVVVTLLASVMPALRATRVPPVAAVQDAALPVAAGTGWRRVAAGTVLAAGGVALLLLGLFGDAGNALATVAAGAVVVFLGVAVLSPLVARPLSRVLGWPFARWAGEPGRLARRNAMRIPRRTASTAAALMIGLALVSMVTIMAASLKASFTGTLERTVAAEYILSGPAAGQTGFSPEVVRRIAREPGIEAAAGVRSGTFKLDGRDRTLQGVDPVAYDRAIRTETTSGSLADLARGGVAIREDVAKERGLKVGDTLPMAFPVGGSDPRPVRAIYEDNEFNGSYLLPLADFQRHYADQLDLFAFVKAEPGTPPAASRAAIDRVVAGFPGVQVRDQAEFKREQAQQIDQILVLFYVLLALAVVIAFIGIINTLALSVLERVREIGLLRAVGMTRGQLRAMIRWEAVIISVLGAVLGLAVGVFFGWTVVGSLDDEGITEFVLPVGTLLAMVAAAGAVGVVSAILPGRRAARLDVLRAIASE
ncbi:MULTISPECIES: ABC transporter permease [Actinomadura]|uniref:ABC transporter permease n=2 Tax=Actinomadura yumaensis TaxID=111807 RepID=A0ABW2CRB6_9ACTN|nr:ABC transporter permease [Actinomadura sp. J1-007]MWK38971.1 FtsX-like permease family protein [Actinomadura sp. J1-007]